MDGFRELIAGGCGLLRQRRRHRQGRLLPLLLLLAVAAASSHPFAAASIFGGDTASCDSSIGVQPNVRVRALHGYVPAPLMRYGKYCGVSYTGCPGEVPCDALDACCMIHDACVQATDNDYLNMWCNQSLLDCVAAARPSTAAATFQGNQCNATEVADEITSVVEAAVYAKGILHKP
ncbi:putative phospholipase A2-like protein 2 [Dichanthelium oligosanthes]|uniref:Putative phospholipase A2-like protein 2 n=1 Tax=Dichanthelium oligosanthes TaxID=888268 RepID=A0A1E5WAT7_9POAL|nr:putative phospholipase A2-like protein 2 [Dichanthelium oligosanthes]